jgi:FHS family L-fucose permease-like MFS transporter
MKQRTQLISVIFIFFFWGFVAAGNDILIPVFKDALHLEQWQSQMVSFAFYIAYTVGSLAYAIYSSFSGKDLVQRIGPKNGLILGLLVSATGTILFYPASQFASFGLMITGLFIVGLGFSLQQIVANPLVISLGNPETGSQRLSLAGGINNIGTTIGPLLVSYAIFGSVASNIERIANINQVQIPYLILGAAFIAMSIFLKFSSLPNKLTDDIIESPGQAKSNILQIPQVWMGMIAIFLYVGVEVATASNLPELMKQELNMPTSQMASYVSLYWASLMIGRWTSAVDAFTSNVQTRKWLRFVMPYLAFVLFLMVNVLMNHDVQVFYIYSIPILILIIADLLAGGEPAKQLMVFASAGILALVIGIFSNGMWSIYAFISVGLFCSTLWPCIFTIAIRGLGNRVNQASGYLIMMIMGGGIISLLQGKLSEDALLGIKNSYWVGVACFMYLAFYAWNFRKQQVVKE